MLERVSLAGKSYRLPEAGEIVIPTEKRPFVALRCTTSGAPAEQLYVQLEESLAISVKQTVDNYVKQGYTQRDFCLKGTLDFNVHNKLCFNDASTIEIQFRCMVCKTRATVLINGKGTIVDEISLFVVGREILKFSSEEVYFYERGELKIVGTPEKFISAARAALVSETDFIYATRFIWQKRSLQSKMALQVIDDISTLCGVNLKPKKIMV